MLSLFTIIIYIYLSKWTQQNAIVVRYHNHSSRRYFPFPQKISRIKTEFLELLCKLTFKTLKWVVLLILKEWIQVFYINLKCTLNFWDFILIFKCWFILYFTEICTVFEMFVYLQLYSLINPWNSPKHQSIESQYAISVNNLHTLFWDYTF